MAISGYLPTNNATGFPFSTSSPALVVNGFFDDSHFSLYSLDLVVWALEYQCLIIDDDWELIQPSQKHCPYPAIYCHQGTLIFSPQKSIPLFYQTSCFRTTVKREDISLSCVRLFATPWKVAYQAPLSMGFSRQEYWSGLPFPSPEGLPNPGVELKSPALQTDALPSEPPGKHLWIQEQLLTPTHHFLCNELFLQKQCVWYTMIMDKTSMHLGMLVLIEALFAGKGNLFPG